MLSRKISLPPSCIYCSPHSTSLLIPSMSITSSMISHLHFQMSSKLQSSYRVLLPIFNTRSHWSSHPHTTIISIHCTHTAHYQQLGKSFSGYNLSASRTTAKLSASIQERAHKTFISISHGPYNYTEYYRVSDQGWASANRPSCLISNRF